MVPGNHSYDFCLCGSDCSSISFSGVTQCLLWHLAFSSEFSHIVVLELHSPLRLSNAPFMCIYLLVHTSLDRGMTFHLLTITNSAPMSADVKIFAYVCNSQ